MKAPGLARMGQAGAVHSGASWFEASARTRIEMLLDPNSFAEALGPEQREMSPHLPLFDLPRAFDDGMIVGRGRLGGRDVAIAAQEGRFMGGTFGEISGAKLVGLLRAARDGADTGGPASVLLLLDTGGVRLPEANAGELAVSEAIRAILEARAAGARVLALVGGRAGAFGGGGIIAACCSRIIVSEPGRIAVTGPEVIETNKGVEEFDSRDRALVWRVTGGRSRILLGGADRYVADDIGAFRAAAIDEAQEAPPFDLDTLSAEQARLEARLQRFGGCRDTPEIWRGLGIQHADAIADLADDAFGGLVDQLGSRHDAR